jgi:hypothetical protein
MGRKSMDWVYQSMKQAIGCGATPLGNGEGAKGNPIHRDRQLGQGRAAGAAADTRLIEIDRSIREGSWES